MRKAANLVTMVRTEEPVVAMMTRLSRSFTLLRILCKGAKAVQQHRGASMALTSGEKGFDELVLRMQRRITNILAMTSGHSAEISAFTADSPAAANLLQTIGDDWQTIIVGWREDRILRNFEFHCQLVENIRRAIVWGIEHQQHDLRQPLVPATEGAERSSVESVFAALLAHIELLAMLRGLSSSTTVIQACGETSHSRIGFLLREVPRRNEALLQTLKDDEAHPLNPSGPEFLRAEQVNVHKFLINIELIVLEQRRNFATQELFQLGTRIVDAHWQIFDQGINALEHRLLSSIIDIPTNRDGLYYRAYT